ncbi:hypothetical protein GYMLUDRAFT_1028647 [Collybiopsis luxurians FD-317 M1]|uniref:T-complex protein 1 subunit alpha n=1 Tax=Collybiopsis luxurians FD-317 M1 TaxID=944289 RepID=A0A0D0C3Z7_9AGAR|nr:hypothetical protein GYMLUDRAFT_1028647 [Collybiopsis luxurians FD-317 M1]
MDSLRLLFLGEFNDGATVLSLLSIENPARCIFDKEIRDGTTSAVIIAAELLHYANEIIKAKIHPTTIITSYQLACQEAVKFMQDQLSIKVDVLGRDALINTAQTTMSSKIIGKGDIKYPVKAVNVLKTKCMRSWCVPFSSYSPIFNISSIAMKKESKITIECIQKILGAGANIVLTTKGIVEAGAMASGFSDDKLILIKGMKVVSSSSIVLQGANNYMLDIEKALHNTLSVIKCTLENGAVVPGGGAVESALSIYLENFTATLVCFHKQLVIAEFASALLSIPKMLAVNAAKDSTNLIAKLHSYHHVAQNAPVGDLKKALLHCSLGLMSGDVQDNSLFTSKCM